MQIYFPSSTIDFSSPLNSDGTSNCIGGFSHLCPNSFARCFFSHAVLAHGSFVNTETSLSSHIDLTDESFRWHQNALHHHRAKPWSTTTMWRIPKRECGRTSMVQKTAMVSRAEQPHLSWLMTRRDRFLGRTTIRSSFSFQRSSRVLISV